MGITGLTSFIYNQSYKFLRNFELHDTTIIVDGNSIMLELFKSNKVNYYFGGDYADYAAYVAEFFNELLMCNVTPIIIFDGALEEKKLKTIFSRKEKKLKDAFSCKLLFPPLIKYVFTNVALQKNIKVFLSTFEADDHIASIARILSCPVLSMDSDFFIHDVMFIPFDTFKPGLAKLTDNFVKNCRIFDRDSFLQQYSIDKKLLILAAAILGNDYIKSHTFSQFFQSLKVPEEIQQVYSTNKKHLKIAAIFYWLSKHSLDSAIVKIISKLDSNQQQILDMIEIIINGYLIPSPKMIPHLGYNQDEAKLLMRNIETTPYKFQSYGILELEQSKDDDSYKNDIDFYIECDTTVTDTMLHENSNFVKPKSEDELEKIVPRWFLQDYCRGKFPSYFLDLLNRQHMFTSQQLQDLSQPPVFEVSLKIMSVIFRLLHKGITNVNIFKYTAKGPNNDLKTYEIDCQKFILNFEIPDLEKLEVVPIVTKKQIFLNTLGITEEFLLKFPSVWRLYIAVIIYWHTSIEVIYKTNYHLHTLILLIIYHVVRNKTQYISHFKSKSYIEYKKQEQCDILLDKSVEDALASITEDDCIVAERFFKSKYQSDKSQLDMSIIHAFALLQNVLRAGMDLNNLLGRPYQATNVAEFFNGTLLYNIFNDLRGYKKLNGRICSIFEKSQSILQLFVSISTEMRSILKT